MNLKTIATLAALGVSSVLFTAPAPAQLPGDLVLSSVGGQSGVYRHTPLFRSLRTIVAAGDITAVSVVPDGQTLLISRAGATPLIFRRTPTLSAQVAKLPGGASATDFAFDQDGSIVAAATDGRLYRVSLPNQLQTVKRIATKLAGIDRDLETGDFYAVSGTDGRVFRSDRGSAGYTTVRDFGAVTLSSIQHMPAGYTVVGALDNDGLRVGRLNGPMSRQPIPFVTALAAEHDADTVWVATAGGDVHELKGRVIVGSTSHGAAYSFTGVDVWSGRKVTVRKKNGSFNVDVDLLFSRSPNRPYCVAASLGMRPGIPIAGKRIYLAVDDLFILTACKNIPGLTSDFFGTLDNRGMAKAMATIPPGLPSFTFYLSAVAVNPTLPGNLDIGNTEVVKVPAAGP